MTVSKEIAEKAARYEKLVNEANELFEELDEWANENGFDGIYAHSFGVSKEVHGEEQSDGEWCDQIMIWEDLETAHIIILLREAICICTLNIRFEKGSQ